MKIKVVESSFDKIKPIKQKNVLPKKQSKLLKCLVNIVSKGDLKKTNFSYTFKSGQNISNKEPVLILMNHSSFIDLEMIHKIFKNRSFNIVTTDDAFIGKDFLLRHLGCIPALKFQSDITLVHNMKYTVDKLKSSLVLFPEASYSFDGTNSTIPDSVAGLIKYLKVPVLFVKTSGAYLRDPLYNNLQVRNVNVSAEISLLISKEELSLPKDEILKKVKSVFDIDYFKEQKENNIIINEPFRADYLNRVLYKCPHCHKEGLMEGKGTFITCTSCQNVYELKEDGSLENKNGETKFNHIPSWYKWQKSLIKEKVHKEEYECEVDGDVYATIDHKAVYKLGHASLRQDLKGLTLKNDDNKTILFQNALANYSLYSDFFWYEVGDIISLGTPNIRYYLVPKQKDVVAKFRIATEEIYNYLLSKKK